MFWLEEGKNISLQRCLRQKKHLDTKISERRKTISVGKIPFPEKKKIDKWFWDQFLFPHRWQNPFSFQWAKFLSHRRRNWLMILGSILFPPQVATGASSEELGASVGCQQWESEQSNKMLQVLFVPWYLVNNKDVNLQHLCLELQRYNGIGRIRVFGEVVSIIPWIPLINMLNNNPKQAWSEHMVQRPVVKNRGLF